MTNKIDAASTEIFRYAYDATGLLTNRWTQGQGDDHVPLTTPWAI